MSSATMSAPPVEIGDLRESPTEVTKPVVRVDGTHEKYRDLFSTDLATIQRRIDTSPLYRNRIRPEVIQKINEKVHTLTYEEFETFNTLHINNDEFRMWAAFQNIYDNDPRMAALIEKEQIDNDKDIIYYELRVLSRYRTNARIAGILSMDDF